MLKYFRIEKNFRVLKCQKLLEVDYCLYMQYIEIGVLQKYSDLVVHYNVNLRAVIPTFVAID